MTSPWIARARFAVTVVLVTGVLAALVTAASRARQVSWPSWATVAVSSMLVGVMLLATAASWVAMFPGQRNRSGLARAFLVGQLGKYVPGGVVQVAGVVDVSRRAGVSGKEVAAALPVHMVAATLVPGLIATAVFGALDGRLAAALRGVLVGGGLGLAVILIRRRWMATLFDIGHRRWSRLPEGSHVPPAKTLLIVAGLGSVGFAAYGGAFAALLAPGDGLRSFIVVASGFLAAFLVGLIALPIPSGVGIREGVLVATVGTMMPLADVLAAAVVLRVTQLAAELAVFSVASGIPRRARARLRSR